MRRITYKKGKIVHLGEKPEIMDLISEKFKERKFVKSDLMAIKKDLPLKSINRHLETLKSAGWLNSKKYLKGTTKDARYYYLSKRAKDYLEKWRTFYNGPVFKKRKPEIEYREVEVPKEIREIDKIKFLGER